MEIKDRVKEFKRIKASELKANPKNWRLHDSIQKEALQSVLQNVGMAGAVVVYENQDKEYVIIDGHLRADLNDDQEVPTIILDVNETEADLLLATFDPISQMAKSDNTMLSALLKTIDTTDDGLQTLLNDIDESFGLIESELPEQETDAFHISNPIDERNENDLENPEELEDKLKEKTKEGLSIMIVYIEKSKEPQFKSDINTMGKLWGLDNHSDIIVKALGEISNNE
jgi:hypothetical protein|tara:strand:+ start:4558 stop:5241 length:684 start_codon:yes stop_codon:yes gene_type:complete